MNGPSIKLRLVIAMVSVTMCAQTVQPVSADSVIVIKHVTIITGTSAPPRSDMTVVIKSDRITHIGKSDAAGFSANARVLDATGKFLIPGLWDMHVHTVSDEGRELRFPLFVANGVTGVRDMGVDKGVSLDRISRNRGEVRQGRRVGPRVFLAGHIFDGPTPTWNINLSLATEQSAREAVARMAEGGSDFIKIYTALPRNVYYAIADEAKRRGLPFAGHVPISVTATEASEAGQKSFEHLLGVTDSCSSRGTELREAWWEQYKKIAGADSKVFRSIAIHEQRALDDYDANKAESAFHVFHRNGTWQCPTLVVWRQLAYFDDARSINETLLRFVPPSWKEWRGANRQQEFAWLRGFSAEDFANERRALEKRIAIVGAMHRAGIRLLAGTDTPFPSVYPGFSLHDELALFVKAGMTPLEALQSATLNAAEFLKVQDSLGTVETGKIADLVLLRANPLDDIENTRSIDAVIVNGRLLERAALDNLLMQVESAAKRLATGN